MLTHPLAAYSPGWTALGVALGVGVSVSTGSDVGVAVADGNGIGVVEGGSVIVGVLLWSGSGVDVATSTTSISVDFVASGTLETVAEPQAVKPNASTKNMRVLLHNACVWNIGYPPQGALRFLLLILSE